MLNQIPKSFGWVIDYQFLTMLRFRIYLLHFRISVLNTDYYDSG